MTETETPWVLEIEGCGLRALLMMWRTESGEMRAAYAPITEIKEPVTGWRRVWRRIMRRPLFDVVETATSEWLAKEDLTPEQRKAWVSDSAPTGAE